MSFSSTANAKRSFILVFAEDENRWVSLKEANQKVIAYWKNYETEGLKLEVLNLSQEPYSLKRFLLAEFIVISKITAVTAPFIKQLRDFYPDARLVFHGLESASLYFANTHLYGLEPYLKGRDLWIMSCEADALLARKSWNNIRTEVVPFDISHDEKAQPVGKDLLFFGRITTQKNLHEAFYALALIQDSFRKEKRKFKIFGHEDDLGVPHLAIAGKKYLAYLKKLASKLGLSDIVEFGPFISEKEIDEELKSGILLSPSVHSDENFGLVAYRALSQGHRAILSYWGGHKDYERTYKNVSYVKVYETKNGLHLHPQELAAVILKEFHQKSEDVAAEEVKRIDLRMEGDAPLEPTELKSQFNHRLYGFKAWPYYGKLFKDYQDPLFLLGARIYGAENPKRPDLKEGIVLPHVRITRERIILSDVRSRRLKIARTGGEDIFFKQLGRRRGVRLSPSERQWLWDHGGLC